MSEVILYIASSLDGFIARKDGDLDWLTQFGQSGEDYGFDQLMKNTGASIMGAKTYEWLLKNAPDVQNERPTYVITTRKFPKPQDANVIFYSGDLSKLITDIRSRTEKNIWLAGGGELAQSFLKENLVDRIILSITPSLIGDGIPLFGNIGKDVALKLVSQKAFNSGLVLIEYLVEK